MRCRGLQEVANPPYLGRLLFSGLLCVAPYCVRSGVKVVSGVRGLRVVGSFELNAPVGIRTGCLQPSLLTIASGLLVSWQRSTRHPCEAG
jgi:hypothetical protein